MEVTPDQHLPQAAPAKSIAVLPFVNMSDRAEEEYLGDGMSEEIINALTRIEGLRVTSRTSAFYFKDKQLPLTEIGRQLNVATILEGSIRTAGNQMRLTAQLIHVGEDIHLFSETFDRPLDDIFAVQNELSLLIADKLREHMGHLEIADQLVASPEISVSAYQEYLKARYLILKMTRADIDAGIAILESLTERYPGFEMGYLGLHLAWTMIATIGLEPADQAFMKGHPYLQRAIELAPDHAECQLQLSYMAFLQDWDLPAAYAHLNRSRAARPLPEYYQSMASILVAEEKLDAAAHHIQVALQLDPLSHINFHLQGFIHYVRKDYAAAIASFERGIGLNPGFMSSKVYLGQAWVLSGQPEACLDYFRPAEEHDLELIRLGMHCLAYGAMGQLEQAEAMVSQLGASLDTALEERAMHFLVVGLAQIGSHEKAMEVLNLALNQRQPMLMYLLVDPMLEPLHRLPSFQQLKQQVIGVPAEVAEPARNARSSLFKEDELTVYKAALLRLMEEERPFLEPDLSLRSLADRLDLSANRMSQLLNDGFGQNFSEFVNAWRLDHFKSIAADPTQQHYTILALALESGFNSKTTFNTYFKKATGQTPSAYWKSLKKE